MNIYFGPKSVGNVYLRYLSQPLLKDGVVMNTEELLWWLELRMGTTSKIMNSVVYDVDLSDYFKQHPVNELSMHFRDSFRVPNREVFDWSRRLNSDDEVKLMSDASMVLKVEDELWQDVHEGPDTATFYGLLKAVIGIEVYYSKFYRRFEKELNLDQRLSLVYADVNRIKPDCSNTVIYIPCKLKQINLSTKKLLMLLRDACGAQLIHKKCDSQLMRKEGGVKAYFNLNKARSLTAASVKKVRQLIAACQGKKENKRTKAVTDLADLLLPYAGAAGADSGDYKVPQLKVWFSPAEYFLKKIGERYPITGGWGYDANSAIEILMEDMSRRIWFEYWFIKFRADLELNGFGDKAKRWNVIKCNVVEQSLREINGKKYDVLTYTVEAYCSPFSYYFDLCESGEISFYKKGELLKEMDKENSRRRKSYNRMLHTKKKGERIGELLSVEDEAEKNKVCYQRECFFDVSEFFGSEVAEESLI